MSSVARCLVELAALLPHHGALIEDLLRSIRSGRVDPDLLPPVPVGAQTGQLLDAVTTFRSCVFERLESSTSSLPPSEARLLTQWFSARTRQILLVARRRYHVVMDAYEEHLAIHDRDNKIVYVNRCARDDVAAVMALTPDVWTGGDHPDELATLIEGLLARSDEAFAGTEVIQEVRFPTPRGWHWRHQHWRPVLDAEGRTQLMTIVSRNIHSRKMAEARLRVLTKVGALPQSIDDVGAARALSGTAIPELADWCLIDILDTAGLRRAHVAHRDPVRVELAEALRRVSPQLPVEIESSLPAGLVWFDDLSTERASAVVRSLVTPALMAALAPRSVVIVPLVLAGANALATLVYTDESRRRHDEADVKLAEELASRVSQLAESVHLQQQVRDSERRFRVGLARSGIGVYETTPAGELSWTYNLPSSDAFAAALRELLQSVGESPCASNRGREVDIEVGGETRNLLLNFEALRNDRAALVRFVGSAIDITEAKRRQQELSTALMFRERMMGVLGEHLQKPLGALRQTASSLRTEDLLPERSLVGLCRIDQAAQRMDEMIQTVIDFARTRFNGELPIARAPIDLGSLCRHVTEEAQAAHSGRTIRLTLENDLCGEWDYARLAQVLSNLVSNALTHGERDSPIWIAATGDDGGVTITVNNRAQPIPQEQLDRLFEPFRQGEHDPRHRRAAGLGLGLYIASEIVQSHGGSISACCSEGLVTFKVRLERRPVARRRAHREDCHD